MCLKWRLNHSPRARQLREDRMVDQLVELIKSPLRASIEPDPAAEAKSIKWIEPAWIELDERKWN